MYAWWARCARRYQRIARPAAIVLCQNDSEPRRVSQELHTSLRTSRSLPTTTQANMIKSDEEANDFSKRMKKTKKATIGHRKTYCASWNTPRKQAIKSDKRGFWMLYCYNTIGDHEKAVEYHLKHLESIGRRRDGAKGSKRQYKLVRTTNNCQRNCVPTSRNVWARSVP